MPARACRITLASSSVAGRGSDGAIELVGLAQAGLERLVESARTGLSTARGGVGEPQAQHRLLSRLELETVVRRHLGAGAVRVHRLPAPVDDVVVDAVLDVGAGVRAAEEALVVGLVLGEEQRRLALHVQPALAELGVRGRDHPRARPCRRPRRSDGFGGSGHHAQVFRNQSVGSTWSVAGSGPRLAAVMRTSTSSGAAFAYSTKTSK